MIFWRILISLTILLTVSTCTVVSSESSNQIAFETSTSNETAIIIDTPDENTAVFDIVSNTGIDKATVTRISDTWPETLMLRFHLNGLENLDFNYTDINIKVEISSLGDNEIRQSVTKNGLTEIINTDSEFWLPILISPTQGDTTIPLEAGTIDVRIPPAFYARNPESFTISWIDFYR